VFRAGPLFQAFQLPVALPRSVATEFMALLACPPRVVSAVITTIATRARMSAYSTRLCPFLDRIASHSFVKKRVTVRPSCIEWEVSFVALHVTKQSMCREPEKAFSALAARSRRVVTSASIITYTNSR